MVGVEFIYYVYFLVDLDDMQSVTDHLVPQALSIAGGSLPAPTETMSLMDDTVIPSVCTDPFLQSGNNTYLIMY